MHKETGLRSILKERISQVIDKNHLLTTDRLYKNGELGKVALYCISLNSKQWPKHWPISFRDRLKSKSHDDRLVIAGAFLAAEIDRLRKIESWDFQEDVDRNNDLDIFKGIVDKYQEQAHYHPGGSLMNQAVEIINHFSHQSATAAAGKLKVIEDAKIYIRSISMLTEMVSMAHTHGEKAARLRGMTEFLNHTADKLDQEFEDDIIGGWRYNSFNRSKFPYENILSKVGELTSENKILREEIEELRNDKKKLIQQ